MAAVVGVGPIAAAVVVLRCCDDARGPTAGAWALMGALVLAAALAAGTAAGLLAAGIRRAIRRRSEA